MNNKITNKDDIIDSRSVIARIEHLESVLLHVLLDADEERKELETELASLRRLAEHSWSDWEYGVSLIHEDYFQEYARSFAEDIGAVQKDATWPNQYIDWKAAAEALKADYTAIDWDGQTYYAG